MYQKDMKMIKYDQVPTITLDNILWMQGRTQSGEGVKDRLFNLSFKTEKH